MSTVRCVVFDFDNTLLLSERAKRELMSEICARYEGGLDVLSTIPTDARSAQPGQLITRDTIFRAFALGLEMRGSLPPGEDAETFGTVLCAEFSTRIHSALTTATEVPGAAAMLHYLSEELGLPCYVNSATPQPPLEDVIQSLGWRPFFRQVLGAPGTKTSNLAAIAASEGIDPAEMVMVGDGDNDCRAATELGCPFVGVVLGPHAGEAQPINTAAHGFSREPEHVVADMREATVAICRLADLVSPPQSSSPAP
jgi:phosphoglycolate phosphatase-like HAD superfamily hydrolase